MNSLDDRAGWDGAGPAKSAPRHHGRPTRGMTLDGWQVAGVVLLLICVSPALATGTVRDWEEGLGITLLSSPLLAWLFVPLRPSDDLFDESNRKNSELVDLLALVIIWTWPVTCLAPLSALGRLGRLFQFSE